MAYLSFTWGRLSFEAAIPDPHPTPPLVFLHGAGCSAGDWRPTLPLLASGTGTVTIDFRAHGDTDTPAQPFSLEDLADDVLALLDHLGIRRAILVGHSLGGMVALAMARRSLTPAGLILLEGWTSLLAAAHYGGERFFGRLPPTEIAEIRRRGEAVRNRVPPGHWPRFWETVERFNAFTCLESTPLPVYEVYGSLGRSPDTQAQLRVPDRPNIRWVWLDDAGHYLPAEKPAEIAELCSEMLGDLREQTTQAHLKKERQRTA